MTVLKTTTRVLATIDFRWPSRSSDQEHIDKPAPLYRVGCSFGTLSHVYGNAGDEKCISSVSSVGVVGRQSWPTVGRFRYALPTFHNGIAYHWFVFRRPIGRSANVDWLDDFFEASPSGDGKSNVVGPQSLLHRVMPLLSDRRPALWLYFGC